MAPELLKILHAQEMRGERIVNNIRLAFVLLSAMMVAGVWEINTDSANYVFVVQLSLWMVFTLAMYLYFRLFPDSYAPRLKYVSTTIDLVLLGGGAAVGMAVNHVGILEYFLGFMPTTFMAWNLLSGFRYSLPAGIYSAALSALINGVILYYAVSSGSVAVSDTSVWGSPAINVDDQFVQIFFIAAPGIVAGGIARMARGLVLRAEEAALDRARLEKEKERLGKYLSKDLVEVVLADADHLRLGGGRKTATVMFTDIRNFTTLSENREPEEVVEILNAYFTDMVTIVFRYGGTLDKFLGDGLMAVFGVPFGTRDEPQRSALVALEMLAALGPFNERMTAKGFPPLDIGIGIATGEVVAGNIGSLDRMEYTCIGDTVNFAARLQNLCRDLGAHIVLSAETFEQLEGALPARPMPPIKVKGKRKEVAVYVMEPEMVPAGRLDAVRKKVEATSTTSAAS